LAADALRDFTLSAQVSLGARTPQGEGSSGAGLVFRWQDDRNYYDVVLNRETEEIEFRKTQDGETTVLANASLNVRTASGQSPLGMPYGYSMGGYDQPGMMGETYLRDGRFYRLEVRAQGDHFEVSVDGVAMLQFANADLATGRAGLMTEQSSAAFDDIRLTTYRAVSDIAANKALAIDLTGDGKINAFDYDALNQIAALKDLDIDGNGGTTEEDRKADRELLSKISRSDFNRDGEVNDEDLAFVDVDQNGTLEDADRLAMNKIVQMSTVITRFRQADVTGDRKVNDKDLAAIFDALAYYRDIDGSGSINSNDLAASRM
jgi:hypothetical protein